MALRKFGTGKILEEGTESPDPIVREASVKRPWDEQDSVELEKELNKD